MEFLLKGNNFVLSDELGDHFLLLAIELTELCHITCLYHLQDCLASLFIVHPVISDAVSSALDLLCMPLLHPRNLLLEILQFVGNETDYRFELQLDRLTIAPRLFETVTTVLSKLVVQDLQDLAFRIQSYETLVQTVTHQLLATLQCLQFVPTMIPAAKAFGA